MGESEEVKLKSRSETKEDLKRSRQEKDKERKAEKERRRDREKEKDRESRRLEREKSVDEKHKEKDRDRERDRDKDKHRDKHRDRKRDREEREDRDREKAREEREKEKEREREREKERAREREKERERREKEREIEREKRERERERKEREREKEREEKERKERERRRREADSDDSSDERRGRERKRRRRDDDHKDRGRERSRPHRHREASVDDHKKKSDDDAEIAPEKAESKEQEMEEEQRRLDDEMEKRRRRVQEWQELKRKKEEEARQHLGEEDAEQPKAGKNWTLEGESDDEEAAAADEKSSADMDVDGAPKPLTEDGESMAVDSENGVALPDGNAAMGDGEEEVDPLDAFMNSMILPEVEKLTSAVLAAENVEVNGNHKSDDQSNGEAPKKKVPKKFLGRIMPDEDSDQDYEDVEEDGKTVEDEDDDEFMKRVKKTKAEKLAVVDHSKIDYMDFRKNFYIEVKEIARMTKDEVDAYRGELELKVHGKDVPKPIKTWHQTGLTTKVLEVIRKLNFEKPMPIQTQALPVIMSGRDCIGIAKTGSGKTLAFVLPMLRHIKDQPPLMSGDGPIALIMAPTRELVQQIYTDIKKFTKVMNLTCVPVYGGSGVAQQIGELKKGAEIVVCTPGRMIDILCTSSGKITNLRRVTYLVMDEADRMFDMGFEPQITRIVQNIRPDRQTVLFSATFPRQVEILAKKVLDKAVEIQVGGRSVVNKDITQMVEVRPESDRYLRLLEILGEWYDKGKILIFVKGQEGCDTLFRNLLKSGYPCLSLHGGKDQGDRESTLADFKSNVCNLLVATSVASRGLDVKELEIVINYEVPNHYEEYVHRVGRTGRAGRKGHAITFISEDEAKYAPDLVKALQLSGQPVPEDLKALADGFMAKVKQGLEQVHGTGYGGSGFKFDEQEDEARKAAKKAQFKDLTIAYDIDKSDSEDDDDEVRKRTDVSVPNPAQSAQETGPSVAAGTVPELFKARLHQNIAKLQQDAMVEHYEAELEINEFPQNARWKVTHKETLGPISDWTGAAITTRGMFFPPGKIPGPGERKLYLFIEGRSEHSVKTAKAELKRVLEDITAQAISLPGGTQPGRYSIV